LSELNRAIAADGELTRLARRSATASGLGAGLITAISGLTLWGVLLAGVTATGGGVLGRVPLAVLTLTALAAFEAVTALPAAAIQISQSRSTASTWTCRQAGALRWPARPEQGSPPLPRSCCGSATLLPDQ
jgi:ATP-binding cassette subfamily C protein CydC